MAHRYGYQLYRCKKNYRYATLSNFCLEKTFNTLITFCSLTLIFINRNPLIIHQSKTFDWNLESCILNYGWASFVLSTRDSKRLPSLLVFSIIVTVLIIIAIVGIVISEVTHVKGT